MALRTDIKAEIDAQLTDEAARQRRAPGWSASVLYVKSGRSIIGYRVTVENMGGFRFAFAQRDEAPPEDINELIERFCGDVIVELDAKSGIRTRG